MDNLCREKGIKREYSVARTPQQNGVAERKNRTLIEAARTMLADSKLPTTFWRGSSTACLCVQVFPSLVASSNKIRIAFECIWMRFKDENDATEKSHEDSSLQDNGTTDQQVNTARPEVNTGSREEKEDGEWDCHSETKQDLCCSWTLLKKWGIDYDEVFAPVARIEAIRMFLAYASYMGFMVYQMDVKSDFLYGQIEEEVYVCQPPGFEDPDHPNKVNKIYDRILSLYSLLQHPRPDIKVCSIDDVLKDFGILKDSPWDDLLQCKKLTVVHFYNLGWNTWLLQVAVDHVLGYKQLGTMGSAGFHQIIDFLNRSHICYALTKKPEVCVSFIKQFWRSAEASTDDNGEVKINATIDGHSLSITEGSLRRHLKLADQNGITSIPNSEIFEQLALMGYHSDSDKLTFQKGAFSPQWRFLIHCILHCLSPKKTVWEQFSSNITAVVICLATNRKFNFSRMIFEHMVSSISSPHKFLMYPRITSSPSPIPSPSPEPTPAHTPSPTQPSPTQPHLNISLLHQHNHHLEIGVLEDDLKTTKQTYSSAFTKLILRVKKLEAQIKIGKARRRAKIVHSDDEDITDDSSNWGGGYYLMQIVQEKASKETEHVIKIRSEEQRKRKDKGKAIMTESEPKKKSKKELEQERLSFAEAIRLEEQMNEESEGNGAQIA
ncbi:ribonuclease H-like domain-containing protein [Tanacetum coccineum]